MKLSAVSLPVACVRQVDGLATDVLVDGEVDDDAAQHTPTGSLRHRSHVPPAHDPACHQDQSREKGKKSIMPPLEQPQQTKTTPRPGPPRVELYLGAFSDDDDTTTDHPGSPASRTGNRADIIHVVAEPRVRSAQLRATREIDDDDFA
jgi:hypothetical protein